MSAIDTNRVEYAAQGDSFFNKIRATVSRWLKSQTTRDELNRLSDRELADIGLSRYDIEHIARAI
ncbi:MAG: DUF1127 domain-containing protein [Paracoccus sp. (in: a-proteobacteria)]|uniref:DUF1127 domain-containing protein n=1 Tax=Paracoccus sp. TaxID=267 RepID=UPI0026E0A30B|nr:DUF1127 domain-containing protein [Paracoccus sp. (in: a-proteobacteria)]MDO5621167.1 DUF1127 domain-containing protein [Paracoccus sp. (in: a-proteobacteria)]